MYITLRRSLVSRILSRASATVQKTAESPEKYGVQVTLDKVKYKVLYIFERLWYNSNIGKERFYDCW